MANARLHKGARLLNLEEMQAALLEGADINSGEDPRLNYPGIAGITALHTVMNELGENKELPLQRKKAIIDFLLAKGANINALTSDGRTPLSFARPWKDPAGLYDDDPATRLPLVSYLLNQGADPDFTLSSPVVTDKKSHDIEMVSHSQLNSTETKPPSPNAAPSQVGYFSNFSQRTQARLAYIRSERYLHDLRVSVGRVEGYLNSAAYWTREAFVIPLMQLLIEGVRAIIDRIEQPPQQQRTRRHP